MHNDAELAMRGQSQTEKPSKNKGTRITVSFDSLDYDEICRIAEQKRVSASWVVRDAVDQYLRNEMPLLREVRSK